MLHLSPNNHPQGCPTQYGLPEQELLISSDIMGKIFCWDLSSGVAQYTLGHLNHGMAVEQII
jgi:hypothetical protein